MSEIKFITTDEELRNHETYKKVESICKKYGYDLWVIINEVYDGFTIPKLQITPALDSKYNPEIHYMDRAAFDFKSGKHDYGFDIQTTSYGALKMEEYSEFLKATAGAYELVFRRPRLTTLADPGTPPILIRPFLSFASKTPEPHP